MYDILQFYLMPANQYEQDAGVIEIIGTIFGSIWTGLDNAHVPGFDFSFADVFIALITAGLVGYILHAAFGLFQSHYTKELNKVEREKRLAERKAGKRRTKGD